MNLVMGLIIYKSQQFALIMTFNSLFLKTRQATRMIVVFTLGFDPEYVQTMDRILFNKIIFIKQLQISTKGKSTCDKE